MGKPTTIRRNPVSAPEGSGLQPGGARTATERAGRAEPGPPEPRRGAGVSHGARDSRPARPERLAARAHIDAPSAGFLAT